MRGIINMMYLILKETHYENIDNSYSIVSSSKDIDVINDDKDHTYSIVRYESPLLLKEEVA